MTQWAERLRPNTHFAEVLPDRKSEKIGGPKGQGKNGAKVGDTWVTSYNMVAIPPAGGVPCRYDVARPPTIGAVMMLLSTIVATASARPVSHGPARKE